jgi:hypothetical protein
MAARRDSASIVRGSAPTAIAPPPGCQIKRQRKTEISARKGECRGRAERLGGQARPFRKLLGEQAARRLGGRRGGMEGEGSSGSVAVPEAGGDAWCVAVEEGRWGEVVRTPPRFVRAR